MGKKASNVIVGALVALLGLWALSNSFSTVPACNYNHETPATCEPQDGGRKSTDQVVNVVPCQGSSNTPNAFGFQIGLMVNAPMSKECWIQQCEGKCLQMTQRCNTDGSPNGPLEYQCVAGATSQDLRPLALFVYLPMIFVGFLIIGHVLKPSSKLMVCGILFVAVGVFMVERSISIVSGCPQGKAAFCSNSNRTGARYSATQVELTPCGPQGVGPFATNIPSGGDPMLSCRAYGCSPKQCLSASQPCPLGTGTVSYTCESQQSISWAEPVNLFFGIGLVLLGVATAVLQAAINSLNKGSPGETTPLAR